MYAIEEWCSYEEGYKKGYNDAICDFENMVKEFVINNGTIPNHTNIELLKIKIKELEK